MGWGFEGSSWEMADAAFPACTSQYQHSLRCDPNGKVARHFRSPCSHSHPATRHQPRPSSPCGPRVTVSVPQR